MHSCTFSCLHACFLSAMRSARCSSRLGCLLLLRHWAAKRFHVRSPDALPVGEKGHSVGEPSAFSDMKRTPLQVWQMAENIYEDDFAAAANMRS